MQRIFFFFFFFSAATNSVFTSSFSACSTSDGERGWEHFSSHYTPPASPLLLSSLSTLSFSFSLSHLRCVRAQASVCLYVCMFDCDLPFPHPFLCHNTTTTNHHHHHPPPPPPTTTITRSCFSLRWRARCASES